MRKGYTLVEIMIVVGIIALLAVIAIPNILRSRLNGNEHYAISNLQTISVAAQTYWSVKNTLPDTLKQLHDERYIDEALGCSATCCPGADYNFYKNGYKYCMESTGSTDGFFVYTTTQTPDVTGKRSFCSGSDGVTRYNLSGATPASQADCTGWLQL